MLRTLSLLAIGVCANALVAVTASAQTATPITASASGSYPRVAVDASGTGHITWQDTRTVQDGAFNYCQLAPTATACYWPPITATTPIPTS